VVVLTELERSLERPSDVLRRSVLTAVEAYYRMDSLRVQSSDSERWVWMVIWALGLVLLSQQLTRGWLPVDQEDGVKNECHKKIVEHNCERDSSRAGPWVIHKEACHSS
jgi:hypothetical protein